jgi:hypothetical protein
MIAAEYKRFIVVFNHRAHSFALGNKTTFRFSSESHDKTVIAFTPIHRTCGGGAVVGE